MKHNKLSCAVAVAALLGASLSLQWANAAPNLVANGSMNFAVDGSLPDWSFLVPGGEFWNTFSNQPSPDAGTYLGVQDLDTFKPRFNVGGITQTVGGLTVGATYDLSFYSMTNHDFVDPAALQDWQVTFGATEQTGKQTKFSATGTWVQSTMTFTATAASQALTFVAEYLPGSFPEMLNLDGIVLTEAAGPGIPSAIPEPSTYALLAMGMAAIGIGARRRKPRD